MREYNKSYNYFAGMPDEDVAKHQKDDTIGHRPTWFVGVNSWARNRATRNGERPQRLCPPLRHRMIRSGCFRRKAEPGRQRRRAPPIRRAERKCLRQLNLEDTRHQGRDQGALQGPG